MGENSLLIKCIHSDQQLQKMERMKKWFEQQDVMDGSVWSSRKESLQKKSVVVSSGSICLEDFEKIKDNQPKSFT